MHNAAMNYAKHPSHLKTYRAWSHMKTRCTNRNSSDWPNYGGRGISYHPDWEYYENFFSDMGFAPENKTLERLNNEEGYSASNCVWATRAEQAKNKRVYKTNLTGIAGVTWVSSRNVWNVQLNRRRLGQTKDFFEACCLRKSGELKWNQV